MNCVRAVIATTSASAASASCRRDGDVMATWKASSAQRKAGYATVPVSRNDASTIHGTATVNAAASADAQTVRVTRSASRYAGIAADVIANALRTCARCKPSATVPVANTGASTSE